MECPRCEADNPDDSSFCEQCGSRLETTCPGCGEPVRPTARFCGKCGQRLSRGDVATTAAGSRFASPETYTPEHLDRAAELHRGLEMTPELEQVHSELDGA